MSSPPNRAKTQKWRRVGVAILCLALLSGEIARRAITGHGHLHRLAVDMYHQFKAARLEKARAALGLPERAEEPLSLYQDALENGWQDWSWAGHDIASTTHIAKGHRAIAMTPTAYKGLYLHHTPIGTAGYGTLQGYIFGDSNLNVRVANENGEFGTAVSLSNYRSVASDLPAGWSIFRIPLTDLGLSHLGTAISGFVFQSATATPQPDIVLDEISLLPDPTLPIPPTAATVAITIDETAGRHPISPYIYGMAFAPSDYLQDLRLGSNRWGGNDKTRYNWVHGNASSAARDWRWANKPGGADSKTSGPSSAADNFIRQNHEAGAATVLTIPTIGWVARDANNGTTSRNVPDAGGAPLTTADGAIAGYDPTENRTRTSLPSAAHKPGAFTDLPATTEPFIYQDEWVHHLVQKFGKAAQNGVRFYAMDNEADLWDSTHTDIHPARMGYDDMTANFLEYAVAVKAVDPSAQVTGPVSSGWTSLLYSSLDRGDDKFHTHADCTKHGGEAFTLWFLKQIRAHDMRTHTRTLDVLDVHFYPQGQGLYSGEVDRDAQARRLRATRALWDPSYTDESWIGEPVRLIPRLKEWIAEGYPDTKIGITEWNFGADKDMNGALAIADVLGIFGREDVYLANYWAYPPKNSPGYLAFRLYRNADSLGHGFGDLACRAVSANPDQTACYAATDSSTGDLTLMLINKMHKATVTAPITFKSKQFAGGATKQWLVSAQHPGAIVAREGTPLRDTGMTLSLPPDSITLIRLTAQHH